jgi:hypothetical protein
MTHHVHKLVNAMLQLHHVTINRTLNLLCYNATSPGSKSPPNQHEARTVRWHVNGCAASSDSDGDEVMPNSGKLARPFPQFPLLTQNRCHITDSDMQPDDEQQPTCCSSSSLQTPQPWLPHNNNNNPRHRHDNDTTTGQHINDRLTTTHHHHTMTTQQDNMSRP